MEKINPDRDADLVELGVVSTETKGGASQFGEADGRSFQGGLSDD